jgi:formate hydrogenlyase subunit 6/NADH:ubiquinone oxidoreductase subunit I
MKAIERSAFEGFVDDLIESDPRDVVGVQYDGSKFVFAPLERAADLRLDYDVTMLSPKKYFFPQKERLVQYRSSPDGYDMETGWADEGKIIVGVHPYDLVAIEQLDEIFIGTQGDEPYRRKRENSILIGVTMQDVSEWSFAGSMGTATTDSGFDLMLTELDDKFAVEIGTRNGSRLLENVPIREATFEEVDEVARIEENLLDQFETEIEFPPEQLPSVLDRGYDAMAVWQEYADGCLSCGTCNVICPTCYCFDVDVVDYLTEEAGATVRRWDGCLLEDFAAVAQGENFRDEVVERHRHRLLRKGKYIYERYGDLACVGCGRCSQHCVADVANPAEIYNELWRHANA